LSSSQGPDAWASGPSALSECPAIVTTCREIPVLKCERDERGTPRVVRHDRVGSVHQDAGRMNPLHRCEIGVVLTALVQSSVQVDAMRLEDAAVADPLQLAT